MHVTNDLGRVVLATWKLDSSQGGEAFCRVTSVPYDPDYTRDSLAAAVVARENCDRQIEKFIAEREESLKI